jgi:hypothetical protein
VLLDIPCCMVELCKTQPFRCAFSDIRARHTLWLRTAHSVHAALLPGKPCLTSLLWYLMAILSPLQGLSCRHSLPMTTQPTVAIAGSHRGQQ